MPAPAPAPESASLVRRRGLVLAVVSVLLTAGGVAVFAVMGRARRARDDGRVAPPAAEREGAEPGAGAGAAGAHVAELPDLLRRARGNPGLLVDAYAAWASDPQALAARKVLVSAMAALPVPAARLATLLAAVEAGPLAPAADPITPDVVAAVSSLWTGDLMRRGRDLLFVGARPRAQEVVFDSFVSFALSDRAAALDGAQRGALTTDFIDLYGRAPPAQRPQILAVVRKLGGADTAELLGGHGLRGEGQLGKHVKYQQELERAKKATTAAP